jgi:hypothetical protein
METPARPDRAVLLIHGIGVQRPRSVLDQFVRGLNADSDEDVELGPFPVPFGADLPAEPRRVQWNGKAADVYEVYWAPQASHKTTARSVLGWLLGLTFVPARRLVGKAVPGPHAKSIYDKAFLLVVLALASAVLVGGLVTLGSIAERARCARHGAAGVQCLGLHTAGLFDVARPRQALLLVWHSKPTHVSSFGKKLAAIYPSKSLALFGKLSVWQVLILLVVLWAAGQVAYSVIDGLKSAGPGKKIYGALYVPLQVGAAVLIGVVVSRVFHRTGVGYIAAILSILIVGWILPRVLSVVVAASTPQTYTAGKDVGRHASSRALGYIVVLLFLTPLIPATVTALAVVLAIVYVVLHWGATFLSE